MFSSLIILLLQMLTISAQSLISTHWPNYIIPIDQAKPDVAYGTRYGGQLTLRSDFYEVGTLLVFDNIPITAARFCTIDFELAPTGPYVISGRAQFGIYQVTGGFIELDNTWNKHPSFAPNKNGTVVVEEGGKIKVSEAYVPCSTSGKAQFVLLPDYVGTFNFEWFELNDPANGLYNGVTFKQWS